MKYQPAPDEAYFDGIGVEPAYRKTGLGRTLTLHVMDEVRRRGCDRCAVMIGSTNEPSRALVRRLGFEETIRPGRLRALIYGEPALVTARRRLA